LHLCSIWYLNMAEQKLTIGYWKIRGLAAPCRMICEYAGVDYINKCYSPTDDEKEAWFSVKPEFATKNALINLPYVVDTDGFTVSQSLACMTYLGRKFDMIGSNEKEVSMAEQVLNEAHDLRNAAVRAFYSSDLVNVKKFFKEVVPKSYGKFEGWLKAQATGPYTVGMAPTVGDFHLWEMVDQCELLAVDFGEQSPLVGNPMLRKLYVSMRTEPKLQRYFSGPLYHLQVNSPFAIWGNEQRSIGELYYFPVRARGEPLRLLMRYAKIPYTDRIVQSGEWPKMKSTVPNGYLPVIKLADGKFIGETSDLARFIATRSGPPLMPVDKVKQDAAARLFEVSNTKPLSMLMPLTNAMPSEKRKELIPDCITQAQKVLESLELELSMSGGAFFGGMEPHYGDFGLFHAANLYVTISNPSPKISDTMKNWYEKMSSLPGVKEYLDERPKAMSGKVGMPGSLIATVNIDSFSYIE